MGKCEDGSHCDCKEEATHECEVCNLKYCEECADNYDFHCDCQPQSIVPIKLPNKGNN